MRIISLRENSLGMENHATNVAKLTRSTKIQRERETKLSELFSELSLSSFRFCFIRTFSRFYLLRFTFNERRPAYTAEHRYKEQGKEETTSSKRKAFPSSRISHSLARPVAPLTSFACLPSAAAPHPSIPLEAIAIRHRLRVYPIRYIA